ncbi:hypothetical protein [Endozoicomonas ascidiicola]|uniref:hypothetical protein n=1 Tax=Endozoicomonas ascidiicola TaxID=1698521 RepID=UPI0008307180|nr:hypothetical protein [Endozoicomonas ascidiicola]
MNEHSFTRSVLKHLPKSQYRWKINDNFAGGVPDFFYEGKARDIWVEFKFIKPFPKRDHTLIDLTAPKYLSKLQQQWLTRRYELRQDCYVVVGSEHGGFICPELSWKTPFPAHYLRNHSVSNKELASLLDKMASTGGSVSNR